MGIEFGRGVFENPDNPAHFDDVNTSIVVITVPEAREAARRAMERCRERWWGIDGAGRYHGEDDAGFWATQPDQDGLEWHTAKYISEVIDDGDGIVVAVDCQGVMPAAMRAAYRDVLVEELTAAGIEDATVRSRHEADYEPAPGLPAGPWPLYMDSDVPGLPRGVPPGRVIHHELRQHSDFWNGLLQRRFGTVWEAAAAAVADGGEQDVVRRACRLFRDAGWAVGEVRATVDGDRKPLTAAAMTIPGAVALVSCQEARRVRGRGLRLPNDARHVAIAVAYYDLEPPTPSP